MTTPSTIVTSATTGISPREALEAEAQDNLAVLAPFAPNKPEEGENALLAARLAQLDEAGLKMLIHHTNKALSLLDD